jgi:hypothetical protein
MEEIIDKPEVEDVHLKYLHRSAFDDVEDSESDKQNFAGRGWEHMPA